MSGDDTRLDKVSLTGLSVEHVGTMATWGVKHIIFFYCTSTYYDEFQMVSAA